LLPPAPQQRAHAPRQINSRDSQLSLRLVEIFQIRRRLILPGRHEGRATLTWRPLKWGWMRAVNSYNFQMAGLGWGWVRPRDMSPTRTEPGTHLFYESGAGLAPQVISDHPLPLSRSTAGLTSGLPRVGERSAANAFPALAFRPALEIGGLILADYRRNSIVPGGPLASALTHQLTCSPYSGGGHAPKSLTCIQGSALISLTSW
jgi:hypothetical protein